MVTEYRSRSRYKIQGDCVMLLRGYKLMKRIFDILISCIGLILVLPVVIILAVLISLNSNGSPIFAQERVGRHEQRFKCYKLRTMFLDGPNVGTHEISSEAITPIGIRIRKTKLDELPQLWNVIRGEMSLVGPRPCLPSQTRLIEARRKYDVFDVIPGITGLAQVNSIDMSTPDELAKLDRQYIDQMNFMGDIAIMWATVLPRPIKG